MTSTKKQNRNRLLYWKKIILTAESHTGTRIEWMRQHGIRESSYYYWHKILLNNGMLDDKDTSHLEGIELPPMSWRRRLDLLNTMHQGRRYVCVRTSWKRTGIPHRS